MRPKVRDELIVETDQNKLAAQEARRNYLADRKIKRINCEFFKDAHHFSCRDCLYFDGRKCVSIAFKGNKDEE
jgi:hypothetical protein